MRRTRALVGMVGLAALLSLTAAACGGDVAPAAELDVAPPSEITETEATGTTAETQGRTEPAATSNESYDDPIDMLAPGERALLPETLLNLQIETQRSGDEPLAPEFVGLEGWINSEPVSLDDLRGKVVLVDFWTYTCINCIRTLPYLKEWHEKYADMGLVILGVHAPEFEFEKLRDNVVMAVEDHELRYAIAQDNDLRTWNAFKNQFWPAKYLIDQDGYIRYTHFGEGAYVETELKIREVLRETGTDLQKVLASNEPELERDERAHSSADPLSNQTRELYAGFLRNYSALRSGSQPPYVRHEEFYTAPDQELVYVDPGDHLNHFLYLNGSWRNGMEELIHARETENYEDYIAIKFSAIEANVVLRLEDAEPYEVRVTIDDRPLDPSQAGGDIRFDGEGNSYIHVAASDIYHLVQLPEYGSYELKLSSNSGDFAVLAYTFGSYLEGPGP